LNKITVDSLEIEEEYRNKGLEIIENTKKRNYFYFSNYWNKENKKLIEEEKDEDLKKLYIKLLF